MPPSLSMILRLGCFCRTPEKTRSIVDHIRLVANEAMALMNGMSGAGAEGPARACAEKENPGTKLPDPKCRASGVSVSSRAFHIGSQWSEAKDGRPSGTGLSGKETVRAPIAAVRRISSATSCGSHVGRIARGMYRSGAAAHHSWMEKSFHAFTQARPRSLSLARWNTPPPKPGKDGKHSAA